MKLFFLFVLLSGALISCVSKQSKKQNDSVLNKPNILFISVDDLNDWPGFLKNFPNVQTPNMDKLAARGMVFSNAQCQAPICAPSRASLFTGLYPHTTGLYYQFSDEDLKNNKVITEKGTFMPDYFEKHGYKTLGVGKIFHNGDNNSVFQEYGGVYSEMLFGPKPMERVNYSPAWFPAAEGRGTATDWSPINLPDSDMSDYKIADWAVNELDKKHDKPFFMAVGFIRPHVPWHVPQKWFDLFDDASIEVPPYLANDFDDIPEISKQLHHIPAMPDTDWLIKENKWKGMVKAYLASMAFVDAQLGKVLDKLEKSDYNNNTIIVLWSDHGYHLGEKGRTAKHSLWERATHVPLVFAGKGVRPNTKSNKPVGLIDLYPTLLDMVGLPENPENEGNSLLPLINDENAAWKHTALTSYGYKNMSLYKGDYHFITYRNGSGELYNLRKDPNEWNNLFLNEAYAEIIIDFKTHLPETHAVLSLDNRMDVNEYIDKELIEFGITIPENKILNH
ncbi:sulfatase [Mariniflexile ostreae]|uniref:Sulfatase n=1 Tax=Mariniflexile ostreae TaxID=1520892 RepID=A0ABV5FF85_9FLAO